MSYRCGRISLYSQVWSSHRIFWEKPMIYRAYITMCDWEYICFSRVSKFAAILRYRPISIVINAVRSFWKYQSIYISLRYLEFGDIAIMWHFLFLSINSRLWWLLEYQTQLLYDIYHYLMMIHDISFFLGLAQLSWDWVRAGCTWLAHLIPSVRIISAPPIRTIWPSK